MWCEKEELLDSGIFACSYSTVVYCFDDDYARMWLTASCFARILVGVLVEEKTLIGALAAILSVK